jgi:hypothetical protein
MLAVARAAGSPSADNAVEHADYVAAVEPASNTPLRCGG